MDWKKNTSAVYTMASLLRNQLQRKQITRKQIASMYKGAECLEIIDSGVLPEGLVPTVPTIPNYASMLLPKKYTLQSATM